MSDNRAERIVRGTTGFLVVISVALGWFVSPWFMVMAAAVGAVLFQSAFTDWCILLSILRRQNPAQCTTCAKESQRETTG